MTKAERAKIHNEYWNLDTDSQKLWLCSKIGHQPVKRRQISIYRNRRYTKTYSLPSDTTGTNIKVCQKMFLTTLGYTQNGVVNSLTKLIIAEDGLFHLAPKKDARGKYPRNKEKNIREDIIPHVNSYNPKPAHYRRSHAPNRKYLPPDLTIKTMWSHFCETNNHTVSYDLYRNVFKSMNISFYMANAENCGTCVEFELNPGSCLEDKKKHLEKNNNARCQYNLDMQKNRADATVFAADMQKIILLPKMPNVKEAFFTPRLITINETFVNMQADGGRHYCFLWHEAIQNRNMENVSSAFIQLLIHNKNEKNINMDG